MIRIAIVVVMFAVCANAQSCTDSSPSCCEWARKGDCNANIYWMRPNCQKSCGTCGCTVANAAGCTVTVDTTCTSSSSTTGTGTSSTGTTNTGTSNTGTSNTGTSNTGTSNTGTSNTGTSNTGTSSTGTTSTGTCTDTSAQCCQWASAGNCNSNPFFMKVSCAKSCGTCGCTVANAGSNTGSCTVNTANNGCGSTGTTGTTGTTGSTGTTGTTTNTAGNATTTTNTAGNATTTNTAGNATTTNTAGNATTTTNTAGNAATTTTNTGTSGCVNSNDLCNFWGSVGECQKNPQWMSANCKMACNTCGSGSSVPSTFPSNTGATGNMGTTGTTGSMGTTGTTSGCADTNPLCNFWSSVGECQKNSQWMSANCKSACSIGGCTPTSNIMG